MNIIKHGGVTSCYICKLGVTVIAFASPCEEINTCVCADVSSEQPRPGEGFSTRGTDAREGV